MLQIGQRVKHSGHAIQPKRDYWNQCGQHAQKSAAKRALDDAIAERGTVTAILDGDPSRGVSPGLQITWDNGTVCNCLAYRVCAAE